MASNDSADVLRPCYTVEGDHIRFYGNWTARRIGDISRQIMSMKLAGVGLFVFDLSQVQGIDTAGAWLIHRFRLRVEGRGSDVRVEGSSKTVADLLSIVAEAGKSKGEIPRPFRPGLLEGIGSDTRERLDEYSAFLAFVGRVSFISVRILFTPMRMRWRMAMRELEEAGFDALPIVGLLSFLIGIVIAYQGGVLLRDYGASVFVADLVGLSMTRELAPMMTAIIVAGRTGSAYTAQIGTMMVTEEVDAMRTMGITPIEMLVLPKLFALVLALPLLTVYSDALGIFGGMFMANSLLQISPGTFIDRLFEALTLESYLIGVGKAPVFAVIIAGVGCFRGFRVRGSAESVGRQTTVSVVESIFLVIVVDATFSIIFSKLGL